MADYADIYGKRIKELSADPTLDSSYEGQVWYNSTTGVLRSLIQIKATSSGGNLSTARFGGATGVAGSESTGLFFGGATNTPGTTISNATEEYTGFTWRGGANMNTTRYYLAGFGTLTAAVAAGGFNTSNKTEVEEYNGTTWSEVTDIPAAARAQGAAGPQTAGLIFGAANSPQVKTFEYDGTNWTAGGDLNTGRKYMAGAGTQTAALAAGGSFGLPVQSDDTEEYDGSTWTSVNSFNTGRRALSGFGTQTSSAIGGGTNGSSNQTGIEEYDGSAWTTSPATLATARRYLGGFGATSKAGVFCGGKNGTVYNNTEEYSSSINVETTGSWATGGTLSNPRTTGSILGTSSTSMLAVGGYRGPTPSPPSFQTQNSVESYNGSSWTAITALPIYVTSGFGAGTTTAGLHMGGSENQSPPHQSTNKSQLYNGSSWSNGPTMTQSQQLGASAGTQTAALLWGGKTGHPTSNTNVTQEYDGSSWTAGGAHPVSNITRTMGTGIQTAAINFGGHNTPPADYDTTFFYNGSSWTSGPTMNIARNAAMGAGTQTLAICGGGYMYSPPAASSAATEWFDGSSWTNIANNAVAGPSSFAGPGGTAASDCLALVNSVAYEWTGQPASTTTASTLTSS